MVETPEAPIRKGAVRPVTKGNVASSANQGGEKKNGPTASHTGNQTDGDPKGGGTGVGGEGTRQGS